MRDKSCYGLFSTVMFIVLFGAHHISGRLLIYPDDDRSPCVMVNVTNLKIAFTYKGNDTMLTQNVSLRTGGLIDGQCEGYPNNKPHIKLVYQPGDLLQSIGFFFDHTERPKQLVRLAIHVEYDATKLTNSTETNKYATANLVTPWTLPNVNYSYYCNTTQTFQLTNHTQVTADAIHLQGYHMVKGTWSSANGSVCPLELIPTTAEPFSNTTTTNYTTEPFSNTTTANYTTEPFSNTTTANYTTEPFSNTTTANYTTEPFNNITTTNHTTPTTKATKTTPKSTTTMMPMSDNKFSVGNGTDTCLLLQAAMEVRIPYGDKTQTYPAVVPKEKNMTHDGHCGNDSAVIVLSWNNHMADVTMTLEFSKVKDNFTMSMVSLNYTLHLDSGTESAIHLSAHTDEFSTSTKEYYVCSNDTTIDLGNGTALIMQDVKIQGFRYENSTNFSGQVNNCAQSIPPSTASPTTTSPKPSDTVVPIVVGCVLGGLVIVVIVGYLIGRRRAKAKANGYETL